MLLLLLLTLCACVLFYVCVCVCVSYRLAFIALSVLALSFFLGDSKNKIGYIPFYYPDNIAFFHFAQLGKI